MFGNASAAVTAAGFGTEQALGVYPVFSTTVPPGAMLTAGGPSSGLPSSGEEIRTIFVTGFPPNVHERELHNLVCFLHGYEASQMNIKPATGTAPQGFALFTSHAAAQAAMLLLHDMQFDTDCHLRCEIAHKNMYLKDDPSIRRADSRRSGAAAVLGPSGGVTGSMLAAMSPHTAGIAPMAITAGAQPFTQAIGHHTFTGLASTLATLRPGGMHHHHHSAAGSTLLPPPGQAVAMANANAGLINPMPVAGFGPVTNKFDNPPCNTLFIGNLGDTVDEGELTALFSCQPGYKQLKLLRHPRQVSCFVEFVDMASASAVHAGLQGALLTSSDRGPIRIQYSKNPYGKRSPHTGVGVPYGAGNSLPPSSASSSAAIYSAAAAAAAAGGAAAMVPGTMANATMANAIMAASAGGEFGGWPQPFSLQ